MKISFRMGLISRLVEHTSHVIISAITRENYIWRSLVPVLWVWWLHDRSFWHPHGVGCRYVNNYSLLSATCISYPPQQTREVINIIQNHSFVFFISSFSSFLRFLCGIPLPLSSNRCRSLRCVRFDRARWPIEYHAHNLHIIIVLAFPPFLPLLVQTFSPKTIFCLILTPYK